MHFYIIIPVLNGEKYINSCIDCIESMDNVNVDVKIIVIDNGSTDSTIDILKKRNVIYKICKNVNVSELRNTGARLATGEYIGFVDSDCLVDKRWMIEAIDILNDNDNVGIVGNYYGISDEPTWVEKAWCERRKGFNGDVSFLPAGNMVVRKSLFDRLEGFSSNVITGEDYEFCQRVRLSGSRIVCSSKVNVKHLGNVKKLRDIVRKERWYGLGMFSSLKNEPLSKPLILTFITLIFITVIVLSMLISIAHLITTIVCFIIYLALVSYGFTSQISEKKIANIILFIPISFCYLLGRSLSLVDIINFKYKIISR